MEVKNNYVLKREVSYCTNNMTLKEAYEKLDQSGFRCIPVLDEAEKLFLGNIYKSDILEFEKSDSLANSILTLVRDSEEYIFEDTSFTKVLHMIKKLPYVAVVDPEKQFLGILTHKKVIELDEDSWGLNKGSYILTIVSSESKGAIARLTNLIDKFSAIHSIRTFDSDSKFIRRIEVTLPQEFQAENLNKLIERLEKNGFKTPLIEKL